MKKTFHFNRCAILRVNLRPLSLKLAMIESCLAIISDDWRLNSRPKKPMPRRPGVSIISCVKHLPGNTPGALKALINNINNVKRKLVLLMLTTHYPDPDYRQITPTRAANICRADIPSTPTPYSFKESLRRIWQHIRNDETVSFHLPFQVNMLKSLRNITGETMKRYIAVIPYTRGRMRDFSLFHRFNVSEGNILRENRALSRNDARNAGKITVSYSKTELNIGVYYAN